MKGVIKRGPIEIWCGKCNWWEYLESLKVIFAKPEAKKKGWKFTKENGWICLKCK